MRAFLAENLCPLIVLVLRTRKLLPPVSCINCHFHFLLLHFEGEDKNGTCPFLAPPELCVSDVDECFIDWDCVANRKCCSNGCYKVCASPSVGGGGVGQLQTAEAGRNSIAHLLAQRTSTAIGSWRLKIGNRNNFFLLFPFLATIL